MFMMDRKRNVEACLVIVTGLLVVYFIKHWSPLLIASAIVGAIGIFFDKPASWITWLWYKVGEVLGAVVSKVILSVVYFIFLFPIALLYRLSGKDRIGLNAGKKDTLWVDREEHTYSRNDMANPW
jgi:hypothetical protein